MATPAEAGALASTRQAIPAPLTRAAIFLVVTINSGNDAVASVQSLCADLAALLRAVGFREPGENLSCIMGFGVRGLGPALRGAAAGRAASVS